MLESLFNFIKKETPRKAFSCEYCSFKIRRPGSRGWKHFGPRGTEVMGGLGN